MSKIVDEAIAIVTAGVKRLAKDEKNQHGGYQFAGIDDFLEMTGKLCGATGLNVLMDEHSFDVLDEYFSTRNGMVNGLRMVFHITLTKEGEQRGPFTRTIIVPANMGSQAFGAAQSYVLKQFLRATFQIPTGEKGDDIDAHDTGTMANPPVVDRQPKPLTGKHKTRAALKEACGMIGKAIQEAADGGDVSFLDKVLADWAEDIEQVKEEGPKAWMNNPDWGLNVRIERAREQLSMSSDKPSIDDRIPY